MQDFGAFFTNPGLYVLLLVIGALVALVRWLFRQAIASERQRADDWKGVAETYRSSVEVLLERLDATTVVAETANKVLTAIPLPDKEARS